MNYEEAYGVHQLKGMGFGIPDDYDPWPMRSALQQRAMQHVKEKDEHTDFFGLCPICKEPPSTWFKLRHDEMCACHRCQTIWYWAHAGGGDGFDDDVYEENDPVKKIEMARRYNEFLVAVSIYKVVRPTQYSRGAK